MFAVSDGLIRLGHAPKMNTTPMQAQPPSAPVPLLDQSTLSLSLSAAGLEILRVSGRMNRLRFRRIIERR